MKLKQKIEKAISERVTTLDWEPSDDDQLVGVPEAAKAIETLIEREKKDDAVAFARWIGKNRYKYSKLYELWETPNDDLCNEEALYKTFKAHETR